MGDVTHVDHEIGAVHLLERRPERRDQTGRQLRDEADRVREDRVPARRQDELAHGRIEGREQLVAGTDRGPGQAVEQGRLAGVGVADQCYHRIGHAPARLAVQAAGPLDGLEVALDPIDALVDAAAVELDLRFARTADEPQSAALALEMRPGADQARALIGQRRQLDLQAAFPALRPGAEDLQDQPGAVDHLALPGALEVALLHRAQRGVDDHEVDRPQRDLLADRAHPAGADQGGRARSAQRHDRRIDHLEVDRLAQPDRFGQAPLVAARGPTMPARARVQHQRALAAPARIATCPVLVLQEIVRSGPITGQPERWPPPRRSARRDARPSTA